MLQINLRWNELYWSSPFFTAESCRFRFLSAPPPTSLSSSKAKGDSMTQPNTDAGRARMQRENMHQLGLPWWCQWYVFFLSHFLLSLSLYIFSSLFIGVFFVMIHHDPPINQPMLMQGPWPCVFCPDLFTTWRAERGEKDMHQPLHSSNERELEAITINQSLVVWSKWVFKHL